MNYFEKRYGAGIEKINIQCIMKTRRNKGRNKTRKGRKGRKTYKTRKYGAGNFIPPLELESLESLRNLFVKVDTKKEENK